MGVVSSREINEPSKSSSSDAVVSTGTSSFLRSRISSIAHASTKKLSKINFKRKGSAKSQTKVFNDLIAQWPITHVEALLRELEASNILLRLAQQAEEARPLVPSIGHQLLSATNKDLALLFKGEQVLVHSWIARSRLDLLPYTVDDTVPLDALLPSILSVNQLEQFVSWLYTDVNTLEDAMLAEIRSRLGSVRTLSEDLTRCEELAKENGDIEIVLMRERGDMVEEGLKWSELEGNRRRLHSSLVSARSPILARLLQRDEAQTRKELVLDESLFPRAFLPLIVHYLYTDQLDLSLVSSSRATCTSSLSEVRAIVAGHSPHAPLHRAAHLIHIARLLGLDGLVQKCEDVLARELSLSTSVALLTWSLDGGSAWIARQAKAQILTEFSRFLHSPHLFELSSSCMQELLSSQWAQATEVDILEGVIRWGEHECVRRVELAQPNVVADTVHSVTRRRLKKCEMDSRGLREIVSPLASYVRVDYVLPPFHQSLTSAYNRGFIERGSLRDLVICPSTSEIDPDLHWYSPIDESTGPRLFLPYYQAVVDRVKALKGDSSRSSLLPTLSPPSHSQQFRIVNNLPELISDEQFQRMERAVREVLDREWTEQSFSSLPRLFHRQKAAHLIATRVLRELNGVEGGLSIQLLPPSSPLSQLPPSFDILPPDLVSLS